jgi:hypothetical protein
MMLDLLRWIDKGNDLAAAGLASAAAVAVSVAARVVANQPAAVAYCHKSMTRSINTASTRLSDVTSSAAGP